MKPFHPFINGDRDFFYVKSIMNKASANFKKTLHPGIFMQNLRILVGLTVLRECPGQPGRGRNGSPASNPLLIVSRAAVFGGGISWISNSWVSTKIISFHEK